MSGIGLGKWRDAVFGFSQKREPALAGDSRWFGVYGFRVGERVSLANAVAR
jgi:hypothetical protein